MSTLLGPVDGRVLNVGTENLEKGALNRRQRHARYFAAEHSPHDVAEMEFFRYVVLAARELADLHAKVTELRRFTRHEYGCTYRRKLSPNEEGVESKTPSQTLVEDTPCSCGLAELLK